jgi:hypothetical protein
VTNLVDVTFVLLVIFMLSAPVIHRSADVRPPSTDQGRIINRLYPGTSLLVEIDALGNVTVAGEPVAASELSARSGSDFPGTHRSLREGRRGSPLHGSGPDPHGAETGRIRERGACSGVGE